MNKRLFSLAIAGWTCSSLAAAGCVSTSHAPKALPAPSVRPGAGDIYPSADIRAFPGGQPDGEVVVAARIDTSRGERGLAAYADSAHRLCSTLIGMKSGAGSVTCASTTRPGLQVGVLRDPSGRDPDLIFGEAPAGTAAVVETVAGSQQMLPLYRVRVDGVSRLFFLMEQAYNTNIRAEAKDAEGRVVARYPPTSP
jgi:hypothetical protein